MEETEMNGVEQSSDTTLTASMPAIKEERAVDFEETKSQSPFIESLRTPASSRKIKKSDYDLLPSQSRKASSNVRPDTADLPKDDQLALAVPEEDDQQEQEGNSRPESGVNNRMPSQHTLARLTRTPGRMSADGSAFGAMSEDEDFSRPSSKSSSGDEQKADILITELKEIPGMEEGAPEWEGLQIKRKDDDEPKEEDWDTDLEDEDLQKEHDPTGRRDYARICEKLGTIPISYFSRHLTDKEITMRYHGLGPEGTKAIANVMKQNITCEKLNLTGNWIGPEGALFLTEMMQENDYISSLILAENKLGYDGCCHICKILENNTGLRILDLSSNEFTEREAVHIAESIEQNKLIKEVSLNNNQFGAEAGMLLGPAIGANDVMNSIDLSWNQIRRKGAIAIAKGLKENVRLKKCDLSWNGFGPEGGIAIADAMANQESINELNMSGNRLDCNVAVAIAKAIKTNEELQILRMGNNPITTTGAIALATAILNSDSSAISLLDLTDIPVEYEFLRTCKEIESKKKFRVIHGPILRSGNTTEDIGKPAIDPNKLKNPLIILREHIIVNDTRILDLLKKYDTEETYSVTPLEFSTALEELGVPMAKEDIDELSKRLDKNNDGKIYYGDIVNQVEKVVSETINKMDKEQ